MVRLPVCLLLVLLVASSGVAPCAAEEVESAASRGAWLGVLLGDAVDGGLRLVALVPGGPAARGGLRPGDILVAADSSPTTSREDLERVLLAVRPGDFDDAPVAQKFQLAHIGGCSVSRLAWKGGKSWTKGARSA